MLTTVFYLQAISQLVAFLAVPVITRILEYFIAIPNINSIKLLFNPEYP